MIATALTAQEVALWSFGAVSVFFTAAGILKKLAETFNLTKPLRQQLKEDLEVVVSEKNKQIAEIHAILSDKVFSSKQEQRFQDIETIKEILQNLEPWLQVPPAVESPLFWCKSEQSSKQLQEQVCLIVKLLETLIDLEKGYD